MILTEKEQELLKALVDTAIKNGNSANTKAFEPTPEQYKTLCDIRNKIE